MCILLNYRLYLQSDKTNRWLSIRNSVADCLKAIASSSRPLTVVFAQKSIGSRSRFIRNNRTCRPRPLDGPLALCAPRLKRVEKGRTRLRPMNCSGSGRATFVAIVQAAGSCQPKAVGCGGGPENLCLATDTFCSCDTSENNKTGRDVGASR